MIMFVPGFVAKVPQVVFVHIDFLVERRVMDLRDGAEVVARQGELSQACGEVADVLVDHLHQVHS